MPTIGSANAFLNFKQPLKNRNNGIINTAPIGADCLVGTTATATLTCSNIDLAAWDIRGSFSHNMDGCGVPIESTTWGGVKAMYR